MSYTKTVWVDGTNAFTPTSEDDPKLNAENLNKIEQGIYDNAVDIAELEEYRQSGVVSATVKNAIIGLFEKCAYIDTDESIASNLAILESWAAEVTSITLSESTLTFSGSDTQTLTATVDPSGSTVTWTSSDTSVATVSDGVVTSVGNGTCVITAAAGNLSATCAVTVSEIVSTYTITNSLTRVTSDNSATTITENSAYTANITADGSYTLACVTVTMGGEDVTSTAYSGGVITISEVTGDIVIEAEADYHYWDFTQSMDDVISGDTPTIGSGSPTQDSEGLHFSTAAAMVKLGDVLPSTTDINIEVEFGECAAADGWTLSSTNGYTVIITNNSNSSMTGGWLKAKSAMGWYSYALSTDGETITSTGSSSTGLLFQSGYSAVNSLSNTTLKIAFNENGVAHSYVDGTEVLTKNGSTVTYPARRGTAYTYIQLGSSTAFYNMVIQKVRVY